MRIVFVGAVAFSRHCLERTVASGGTVAAVFAPRRDAARINADYACLGDAAERLGIPAYAFDRIGDPATVAAIRALAPDVIFVFGLSQLLPAELLAIPPLGVIGSHPSLLPYGRGRHPLIWALIEDLPASGLSFFYMDEGADTGDLLWQGRFPIDDADDAASLYRKMEDLATLAIAEFVPQLAAGTAPRCPQDHARATYWRRRTAADGLIDWAGPTRTAFNLIRALTHPYVGAHTLVAGRTMMVWRASVAAAKGASGVPGTVLSHDGTALLVRTGDGALRIDSWEMTDGGAAPEAGMVLGGALA